MERVKEVVSEWHESGKFEYVKMYESREELLQDLSIQYHSISYDSFDDSIDKDKKVFALVMIEAKKSRYHPYSESAIATLES